MSNNIHKLRDKRKNGVKIKIKDRQRRISINKKDIIYLAKGILKIKGLKSAELSILFVGRQRIRAFNKKFRKVDKPTNVLAFSMREGKDTHLYPTLAHKGGVHPEILGDVVICPEIAQDEIYLCLVHGILHLLGYDDLSVKCRSLMEKEQTRILNKVMHSRC